MFRSSYDEIWESIQVGIRLLFSLPPLAVINLGLAISGLVIATMASWPYDLNQCGGAMHEQYGGYIFNVLESLQNNVVSLKLTEFGIPDFINTPLIPLSFIVVYVWRTWYRKELWILFVNGLIGMMCLATNLYVLSTEVSLAKDNADIGLNIIRREEQRLLEKYEHDAGLFQAESGLPETEVCRIKLQMHTLNAGGLCGNAGAVTCLIHWTGNEDGAAELEERMMQWLLAPPNEVMPEYPRNGK